MTRKFLLTIASSLVIVALFGCAARKPIRSVVADPARYYNDDVVVTGTVSESWGVMGVGAYQLDDGTGKIWVIPNSGEGLPPKGAQVSSKGRVQSGFSMAGRSFAVVLREKDQDRRD